MNSFLMFRLYEFNYFQYIRAVSECTMHEQFILTIHMQCTSKYNLIYREGLKKNYDKDYYTNKQINKNSVGQIIIAECVVSHPE